MSKNLCNKYAYESVLCARTSNNYVQHRTSAFILVMFSMARLSLESRRRFVTLHSRGFTVSEIKRRLCEVSTSVSY